MKVKTTSNFMKDIKKLDAKHLKKIFDILHSLENTDNIYDIQNCKKMSGYSGFYRIRIGFYRLGCEIQGDVVLLRTYKHRKDIYRYFP